MRRFFNTTGPCDARRHYLLPPEERAPALLSFVQQELYFVVHAARQTGKTTAMRTFAERLRGLGYVAVWATLEESQGVTETADAEPIWIAALERGARYVLPASQRPPDPEPWLGRAPGTRFHDWISAWAAALGSTPLVLLLDEADVASGPALVSLLRQLRAGFMDRGPGRFPISVALIGMRDLRDYLTASKDGHAINPGSPFNIKAASITLRDFTRDEVAALYQQHAAETGQHFEPSAVDRAFYWTQGQPFLVNALARICTMDLLPDPTQTIVTETVDAAKEQLIRSRTTHLDALAERLREPRVARVLQAVLLTDVPQAIDYRHDDFQYVVDLGLIREGPSGAEPANPLYAEVLGRELSYNIQTGLNPPRWRWQTNTGGLDMPALIAEFLAWWRTNAAIVEQYADRGYVEAVPHLAFMGFLQRVVNGGGSVHRAFAAGRGAIDLLVVYAGERHVIELKRVPPQHRSLETVREEGVEQLARYLDTVDCTEGWLLIFDQRADRSWEERLWTDEVETRGRRLHLRGA